MTDAEIEVSELTWEAFGEHIPGGAAQAEYLWAYLESLGARSMICEQKYVDRHYLDDFTEFYARSFRPPSPHCRRLHFFSATSDEVVQRLADAYEATTADALANTERELNSAYLGFVVCRPLHDAPIGRTVLRTYPADGHRQYSVLREYRVHVGALKLTIEGLAYQQQDVQVAVCASTALWCALQKVAHLAGIRTPTPSQVTRAANSPYPASYGLTDPQMATALTALGYAADSFSPGDPQLFRAKLAACLRSHLPVILMVGDRSSSHAVCVTGYRDPEQVVDVAPFEDAAPVAMRTGSIQTIYVHDDNLGSHAHYELLDHPPGGTEEGGGELSDDLTDAGGGSSSDPEDSLDDGNYYGDVTTLWLRRGRDGPEEWWKPDCLPVLGALVPKPWKVRMPVDDLLNLAWSLRHRVEPVFDGFNLIYDARFGTGIEYRRSLIGSGFERSRLQEFDWNIGLPRHIAIVTVATEECELCDLILDATTMHLNPDEEDLLAIVAHGVPIDSPAWKYLESLARDANAPLIGAPSTFSPGDKS